MSTSVQQTMEDVVLKPAVVTWWVVSHVPVTTDSLEMDLAVPVRQIKAKHYIFWPIYTLYTWVCFVYILSTVHSSISE